MMTTTDNFDREQQEQDSYDYRNEQEAERFAGWVEPTPTTGSVVHTAIPHQYVPLAAANDSCRHCGESAASHAPKRQRTEAQQRSWDAGYRYGLEDAVISRDHRALVEAGRDVLLAANAHDSDSLANALQALDAALAAVREETK